MSSDSTTTAPSSGEVIEAASTGLVGVGILVMALFPLAIPLVALLAVAAIPLLAVALAGAVLLAPVLLVHMFVAAIRARSRVREPRVMGDRRQIEHRWMSFSRS
jgi:hypothetical protein